MAGMTSLIADELLFQVLREIGLIPQLYKEFVSNERTVVALPSRKYSRSFSMNFLAFTNELYSGLLRQSLSVRTCSVCWEHHGQNYLCLPDFLHPDSVDLLFDILEWRRGYVFRGGFVVTSTPLWLFTDQIGCASRIPGALTAFGRNSNVERCFGLRLRTLLERISRNQLALFTRC